MPYLAPPSSRLSHGTPRFGLALLSLLAAFLTVTILFDGSVFEDRALAVEESGIAVTFEPNTAPLILVENPPFQPSCAWGYRVVLTETKGVGTTLRGGRLIWRDGTGKQVEFPAPFCGFNFDLADAFGDSYLPPFGTLTSDVPPAYDGAGLMRFPTPSAQWIVEGVDANGDRVRATGVVQYGLSTTPACPDDFDGDGIQDIDDVCPEVANPDQIDSDGDQLGDVCDETNPGDIDSDHLSDFEETFLWGSIDVVNDPTGDEDDDGLLNFEEFFYQTNPLRADSNGDGISDEEGANTCDVGVGCPNECDDQHPCTFDYCDVLSTCTHTPIEGCCQADADCDDDNRCTADSCAPERYCLNIAVDDCCTSGGDCDDGNVCTDDVCDATGQCVYSANQAACDDGNPCTAQDTCVQGACMGTRFFCHPNETCEPTTGSCKRIPVLVLPGIMGSELRTLDNNRLIWLDGYDLADPQDGFLLSLALRSDGITPDDTLRCEIGYDSCAENQCLLGRCLSGGTAIAAERLLRVETALEDYDAYDRLMAFLRNQLLYPAEAVLAYPYDWRFDLATTSTLLCRALEARFTGAADQVDVIAHSQGGLVIRAMLAQSNSDCPQSVKSKIRSVIYLGTPHKGAPIAYATLRGYNSLIAKYGRLGEVLTILGVGVFDFTLNPRTQTFVSRNFPAVYQLLPRFDLLLSGPTAYEPFGDTYERLGRDLGTSALVRQAEAMHTVLGDTEVSSAGYAIVGTGVPTLEALDVSYPGCPIVKVDSTGDGTVPTRSSTALNGVRYYYVRAEHSELPGQAAVWEQVRKILFDDLDRPADDITTTPVTQSVWRWSACSPVDVTITDTDGNTTGQRPDGIVVENIVGARHFAFESSESGFLPANRSYRLSATATADGEFTLRLHREANDGSQSTAVEYANIAISRNSKATLTLAPSGVDEGLSLDVNGDGVGDFILSPNQPSPPEACLRAILDTVATASAKRRVAKKLSGPVGKALRALARGKREKASRAMDGFLQRVGKQEGKGIGSSDAESLRRLTGICRAAF